LQEWLIGKAPIHFGERPLSKVWLDLANAVTQPVPLPSGPGGGLLQGPVMSRVFGAVIERSKVDGTVTLAQSLM